MVIAARASGRREAPSNGAVRAEHVRGGQDADRAAIGLAPASDLSLPSLAGVPAEIRLGSDTASAMRLARALVSAGVAGIRDWEESGGDLQEFIRMTVQGWIDYGAGGLPTHDGLQVVVVEQLTDLLGVWVNGDEEPPKLRPNKEFYIALFAESYVSANLGNAVRILAAEDPRLASTFHNKLAHALSHYVDVFTWQVTDGAAEWLWERNEEIASLEKEDYDARPMPNTLEGLLRGKVPDAVLSRPYSDATLTRRLRGIHQPVVRSLLLSAIELERLAKAECKMPREMRDALRVDADDVEWEQPWSAVLLAFDPDDDMHGMFDDTNEWRSQLEGPAAPCFVCKMRIDRPETFRHARLRIENAARVLGHFLDLIQNRLPLSDDASALANILSATGQIDNRIAIAV